MALRLLHGPFGVKRLDLGGMIALASIISVLNHRANERNAPLLGPYRHTCLIVHYASPTIIAILSYTHNTHRIFLILYVVLVEAEVSCDYFL